MLQYRMARTVHPDVLDKLIIWNLQAPSYRRQMGEDKAMQRQFNISLNVDYADAEKNQVMREALQQAARHIYATASLLADQVKPKIAIWSDDYFTGEDKIELLEDTISKGIAQITTPGEDTGSGVSDELMNALKVEG